MPYKSISIFHEDMLSFQRQSKPPVRWTSMCPYQPETHSKKTEQVFVWEIKENIIINEGELPASCGEFILKTPAVWIYCTFKCTCMSLQPDIETSLYLQQKRWIAFMHSIFKGCRDKYKMSDQSHLSKVSKTSSLNVRSTCMHHYTASSLCNNAMHSNQAEMHLRNRTEQPLWSVLNALAEVVRACACARARKCRRCRFYL